MHNIHPFDSGNANVQQNCLQFLFERNKVGRTNSELVGQTSTWVCQVVSSFQGFRLKSWMHFSFLPFVTYTTRPAHLILLELITLTMFGDLVTSTMTKLAINNFLHSVTSCLLDASITLSALLSDSLNPCSFIGVRDEVSHTYKTTGKTTVLYILIFTLIDRRRKDKRLWTER